MSKTLWDALRGDEGIFGRSDEGVFTIFLCALGMHRTPSARRLTFELSAIPYRRRDRAGPNPPVATVFKHGRDPERIRSIASFYMSRVDKARASSLELDFSEFGVPHRSDCTLVRPW